MTIHRPREFTNSSTFEVIASSSAAVLALGCISILVGIVGLGIATILAYYKIISANVIDAAIPIMCYIFVISLLSLLVLGTTYFIIGRIIDRITYIVLTTNPRYLPLEKYEQPDCLAIHSFSGKCYAEFTDQESLVIYTLSR